MIKTLRCGRVLPLIFAAMSAITAPGAAAQAFPTRPIEFIVHTSPGGGTDVFARAVSEFMGREKIFSQPLTVSNRTGGSGGVAFNYVKSKKGDPHVVLTIATGTLLTAASRPELGLGLDTYTPPLSSRSTRRRSRCLRTRSTKR